MEENFEQNSNASFHSSQLAEENSPSNSKKQAQPKPNKIILDPTLEVCYSFEIYKIYYFIRKS